MYDGATGEAVAVATTSGGLQPYGVDAVFLADSSVYDSKLATGNHTMCVKALKYAEHAECAVRGGGGGVVNSCTGGSVSSIRQQRYCVVCLGFGLTRKARKA